MDTSRLVFGTAGLTALPSYSRAIRLLEEAESCGISHFDTAPTYGRGYAEWILGRHLARARRDVLVTTKFGLCQNRRSPLSPRLALPLNRIRQFFTWSTLPRRGTPAPSLAHRRITMEEVSGSLTASLRALGKNSVHLYLLHEGLPSFLDPRALDFLLSKRKEGVIELLGVGTNSAVLRESAAEDFAPFDVLQYEAGSDFEIIRSRFQGMVHYLHGCFRRLLYSAPAFCNLDSPLRRWLELNKEGKVIFFSSRKSKIRENVGDFLVSR